MKRFAWLFISIFSVIFLASCASQKNVVAEFGDNDITYDELQNAYYKNLSEEEKKSENPDEGMKDFLELYVNYKMKLRDAQVRGFDKNPELQKEIDDYTKTVGVPYVEEKFIIEPGLKKLYDQRKIEKRVSHILLRVNENSVDSVMQLAEDIIKRAQNGENFADLAKQYSDDEFSKGDGGDIYWLTAGQTVPEFDEAVYETKKGEVYPKPIRTKYGIHVLKVTDEQPRVYQIKAEHILATFKQNNKIDTASALAKIREVQAKLEEGASFEELAKEYSDDPGSKDNGGDLGYFQRRMMVKPFDEAAFSLEPGEISDVVETRFGFHIIKVTDRKDMPPFEQEKEKLKPLYQGKQYPIDKEEYLNSLKEKYPVTKNDNVFDKLRNRSGYLKFDEEFWDSDQHKELSDSILVSIGKENLTVTDFMNYAISDSKYATNRMTNGAVENAVEDYVVQQLLIQKALDLRSGDTEFAKLMDDYKNGLYIFKLQEDEIWNKIEVDTTKLIELYEKTKDNYMWPNRVAYNVIYRADSADIYTDKAFLDAGASFETIMDKNAKEPLLKSRNVSHALSVIEGNRIAENAYNLGEAGDISQPFKFGNGWYIVQLTEKVPARHKTFEEAQSELVGVYQEQQTKKLEEEYIKQLRKLYEPELYYDRLSELQKK